MKHEEMFSFFQLNMEYGAMNHFIVFYEVLRTERKMRLSEYIGIVWLELDWAGVSQSGPLSEL